MAISQEDWKLLDDGLVYLAENYEVPTAPICFIADLQKNPRASNLFKRAFDDDPRRRGRTVKARLLSLSRQGHIKLVPTDRWGRAGKYFIGKDGPGWDASENPCYHPGVVISYDNWAGVWVSHDPVLDLYGQGETPEQAALSLASGINLWTRICADRGILRAALEKRGVVVA